MLQNIFTYLFNNGLRVSVVILIVFVVRLFFRNVPKKYSYILWMIVGIYLLCPVRVSSPISIYNLVNNTSDMAAKNCFLSANLNFWGNKAEKIKNNNSDRKSNIRTDKKSSIESNNNNVEKSNLKNEKDDAEKSSLKNEKDDAEKISLKSEQNNNKKSNLKSNEVSNSNKSYDISVMTDISNKQTMAVWKNFITRDFMLSAVSYIWLFGCIFLIAWNMFWFWRIKKNISMAIRWKDNIYECDNISTPFVLGIVKAKIYIPFHLGKKEREYILLHEYYHIQRKDQFIKLCAYLLCIIYWFHPLVWFSYFAMIRDMEMSCDEYVLKHSANDIRTDYSTLLLDFATKTQAFSAGLLAFGESDTRRRVKNIMKFTTRKKWVGIVAAVVIIITGISCLTNAVNNTETRSNKIAGTSAVKKSKSVSDNKHVIKVGTKNSIPIEAIPENVESAAIPILKKIEQTFPKEVYQEILHKGQIHLKKYKSGEIVCSITNKNIDDTIYLDLYFDGNGVLTNMLNYCKVKKVQNISKRAEVNKVVNFAKTFLNTEVTYSKKKKNNSTDGVTITEGKLPELYQNSNCLSGYKDSLGNIYFYNRDRGMIISFYMDE